jgi:ABC-type Fe3+-hydroxamate transport system substrate-binding protein
MMTDTKVLRRIMAIIAAAMFALAVPAVAAQSRPQVSIIDSLGREVAVPGTVGRIISLEPEITRIIVALGAGERLVGIDFFLRHYDHLLPIVFPSGGLLPVVSNQGQGLNYEEAIRLRPDIVFASPSEVHMAESIQKKLEVPVVSLASMGRIGALLDEIGTVGRILGREDRAARLVAVFRDNLAGLQGLASSRPGADHPSVYLAFWGSLVRTPVSYEPVDMGGGRNVASGLLPDYLGAAGATVSIEKILLWDPEVILVQGNYLPAERQLTIEDIRRDRRLASVRAVKSGRVYYTFGFWYWWDPALVLIESLYLSRLLHSGRASMSDLIREGDAIFKEFYGVDGAFNTLCRVLACDEWTTR